MLREADKKENKGEGGGIFKMCVGLVYFRVRVGGYKYQLHVLGPGSSLGFLLSG